MTKEKTYTEEEAKNLLLRLAGDGIIFSPHSNPTYLRALRRGRGKTYVLVFCAGGGHIIPKWPDQESFWKAYDAPDFNNSYLWKKL